MARRMDRRVQRTRKLLRESLMDLILEEGYDTISIQDITDKANLGRATFYLHFKDKDELLLDVMDQFMADFLKQVPQFSQTQWRLEDTKALVKVFDFAADHYDLYRIMIISSGGVTASRQLHQTIAENFKDCIQKEIDEQGADPVLPADFIANHFAGSLLATIYWWLDSDLPYTVEEMAEMFQKINRVERDSLMGLDDETERLQPGDENEKRKKRGKENNSNRKDKKESDHAEEVAIDAEDSDQSKEQVLQ